MLGDQERPFDHAGPRSDDVGLGHDRCLSPGAGQSGGCLAVAGQWACVLLGRLGRSILIGGWLLTLAMLPKPDVIGVGRVNWRPVVAMGRNDDHRLVDGGGGFVLVFLFSSTRPLTSVRPRDLLLRGFDGVFGLTGVTKAFGDALSYLRLFALGLASAQLAMLFNQMAHDATQVQGVGILLGLLVFLLGHTLNFVLAVVGGVVHGLRLNCIEFFSWSLTEEGQPFKAFEMKANE